MDVNLAEIQEQVKQNLQVLLAESRLAAGDVLLLGGSSSEIRGETLGQGSSAEIGEAVVAEVLAQCREAGVYLAVQCCEHLNRALVVEKFLAKEYGLRPVNALPQLNAGGSFAVAAWSQAEEPCLVESIQAGAGIDIGDVLIGMHLRPVAVPLRLPLREIGQAHVTAARTRMKYIGGGRAAYQVD